MPLYSIVTNCKFTKRYMYCILNIVIPIEIGLIHLQHRTAATLKEQ